MIALVRAYQVLLSPLLGGACRFHPSCSEYTIAVIRRDGPWLGSRRAAGRLLRCTPLRAGGLDLP
jgi:putative membrane protein insertion efficiency factor